MKINGTACIWSTVVVIWIIVAMTLLAEVSTEFETLLVQLAGHHWIGKGVVAVLSFAVSYILLRKLEDSRGVLGGVLVVVGSVILGGMSIFSFFLWHFLAG